MPGLPFSKRWNAPTEVAPLLIGVASRTVEAVNLLPARLAHFTVESLHIEHAGHRAWVYWLLLLGTICALISLPLIKIDDSVRADGIIRPARERSQLLLPVSGYIAQVLAHDNEDVHRGQPLMIIRSDDLDERLTHNSAMQADKAALVSDLTALSEAHTAFDRKMPTPNADGLVLKTAELNQERSQFLAQLHSNDIVTERAKIEYGRNELLATRGLVTQRELDNARFALLGVQSDRRSLIEQTLTRWQSRLAQEKTAFAGLLLERRRLLDEQSRHTLRAPVDGVLVNFQGWSPGAYLSAGQSVGFVSPEDTLVLEALVSSRDIGQVRVNQSAKIQVDAYPYSRWGTLSGAISSVSGDSTLSGDGGTSGQALTSFKVLIRLNTYFLTLPGGTRGDLKKGMTAHARLMGGERSLWTLLTGKVSEWADPTNQSVVNSPK